MLQVECTARSAGGACRPRHARTLSRGARARVGGVGSVARQGESAGRGGGGRSVLVRIFEGGERPPGSCRGSSPGDVAVRTSKHNDQRCVAPPPPEAETEHKVRARHVAQGTDEAIVRQLERNALVPSSDRPIGRCRQRSGGGAGGAEAAAAAAATSSGERRSTRSRAQKIANALSTIGF